MAPWNSPLWPDLAHPLPFLSPQPTFATEQMTKDKSHLGTLCFLVDLSWKSPNQCLALDSTDFPLASKHMWEYKSCYVRGPDFWRLSRFTLSLCTLSQALRQMPRLTRQSQQMLSCMRTNFLIFQALRRFAESVTNFQISSHGICTQCFLGSRSFRELSLRFS